MDNIYLGEGEIIFLSFYRDSMVRKQIDPLKNHYSFVCKVDCMDWDYWYWLRGQNRSYKEGYGRIE